MAAYVIISYSEKCKNDQFFFESFHPTIFEKKDKEQFTLKNMLVRISNKKEIKKDP